MNDVSRWLDELGLGHYAEIFAENAIGPDVLSHLTDEHLKELGVALGDRVRILKAIESRADRSSEPSGASPSVALTARIDEPERRQLTVMFCDLVDSTAMSRKLDPEDLRDLNLAYQDAVKVAVERYNGFVARYMGDGVLAYFGYPHAHEDDAERAVRAGLGIVEEIAKLHSGVGQAKGVTLAVRVGIATGPVVVGDLIGKGASQESAVVGETPNLAAKLQGFAEPDSVVVASITRRLTAGHFEYRDLGERDVKGLPAPVPAWQVVGESTARSRFEAAHGRHLIPLVGRDEEVALLARRWSAAKQGEGQVVLICGEPGIGKSRLAEAFASRTAAEPHVRLRYQCSPHHANSALYPIIAQLEYAAGVTAQLGAGEKLEKLESLLGKSSNALDRDIPLLADLLSIPITGHYADVEPDAKRRRQQTLDALVRQLEGLSHTDPVLCIFEDVHWIDPSTRELLDRIVDRVESLPVFLIITFRPEFEASWIGQAGVSLMTLSRIGRKLSREMVERLAGAMAMPAEVVDEVVARTDGVPLFIEELTRTVVESEQLVGASDGGRGREKWKPSIPMTLHDSLMARLDQLMLGKPLAQIGSVIGRDFDQEILSAVCEPSAADVEGGMRELEVAGLVFRRGTGSGTVFSFKHALVQDAAYESLLREKKRELHERVARAIEEHRVDLTNTEPEVLAHHFSAAGIPDSAIRYWYRAGQRASERSASLETIAHIEKGLNLLDSLPNADDRAAWELRLQVVRGPALMNTIGSASAEVRSAYRRACELSELAGDAEQKFVASWGLWLNRQMAGDFESARQFADEVIALGDKLSDSTYLLQAHHAAWTTLGYLGDQTSALEHTDQGLALYDVDRHHRSAFIYGDHDAGVCGHIHKAMSLWQLGYPDRAIDTSKEGLKLAETLSHPLSSALIGCYAAIVHQLRGEPDAVLRLAEAAAKECARHGLEIWSNNAEILRSWATAALGDDNGVESMRRALEQRGATGSKLRQVYYLTIFAELLADAGAVEDGLEVIERSLTMLEESGERRWEPYVHKINADLMRAKNEPDLAVLHFNEAISVARRQKARSFVLRATIGLADLRLEQGDRKEAGLLLDPIYASFDEGFDTCDLRMARALLERTA